jgi:hypothetical protein
MVPYPVAQVETGACLVATLGRQIQAHVGTHQFFGSTTVGRIGVENVAGRILVEHTDAGHFLDFDLLHFVVVVDIALRDFLLRERYLIVVIEAVTRRTRGDVQDNFLASNRDRFNASNG